MAKQTQNLWIFVIVALIVGIVIGYAAAGGLRTGGKAITLATKPAVGCPDGSQLLCSAKTGSCSCVSGVQSDVSCASPGSGVCAAGNTQQNCNTGTYCCSGELGGNGVTCSRIA